MRVCPGSPTPLGATWDGGGVNFALFSEHATGVSLCLFDGPEAVTERLSLPLTERTDRVWHIYLPEVRPGQLYGYRVTGPWAPKAGHRFNPTKVLLDPYARAIGRPVRPHLSLFATTTGVDGDGPMDESDDAAYAPLGAVVDGAFDWANDRPPCTSWADTVIYELHVKGLTALNREIPPEARGTYLGLASEPAIRHLRALGVTAVELLPVHHHQDEWALLQRQSTNYWGYNTLSYFAPDARFASSPAAAAHEFRSMVRALHAAGIEVILDVVYNHTAEGDHLGPSLSFRGIDNASYYRLQPDRPARYEDFTGTGNTLDLRTPEVIRLVMDSLRYWVTEMHVDGFRFDLASALAREASAVDRGSGFLDAIAQDPILSRVKLIAEPWDVGPGGYQVGGFPPGWSEWNGQYRDVVRRFWRGDAGMLSALATRMSGSSDLYGWSGRRPHASINFITSHDGFTLADLTAYNEKHNDANGEDNRDGDGNNLSWNSGAEGPTTDEAILDLRRRQQRNFIVTLFASIGVPMISGGDEVARTQRGNNNAYCHDSLLTWTPWDWSADDQALLTFVQRVIRFRREQPVLRRRRFLTGRHATHTDVLWLRPDGREMSGDDWGDPTRRTMGVLLDGDGILEPDAEGRRIIGDTVLILLNASGRAMPFFLPRASDHGAWETRIDTTDPAAPPTRLAAGAAWILGAHSATVMVWQKSDERPRS